MGQWVVGRVCLKIKKRYILASSVLGPNLQLPAHELLSPISFYETLNKGKLSAINYKHFSFCGCILLCMRFCDFLLLS